MEVAATVHAISQQDRHVTLLRRDGTQLIVVAAPAVRSLHEVKPGDSVRVIHQLEVTLAVASRRPEVSGERTSPSPGARQATLPAGAPGAIIVRIEAIDISENTVTFTRANGEREELRVIRPDAEKFMRKLRPGDEVLVTYGQAVAVSIEPNSG